MPLAMALAEASERPAPGSPRSASPTPPPSSSPSRRSSRRSCHLPARYRPASTAPAISSRAICSSDTLSQALRRGLPNGRLQATRPPRRPPASRRCRCRPQRYARHPVPARSEEHTSELQSQFHLVCRLLLEKKKIVIRLFVLVVIHRDYFIN